MIAAELRGGDKPSLNEALGWIGSRVDDIYGAAIGRLEDVWIDPGTGEPRWLLVKEGRFGGRSTLVPFSDVTAGAGHVWIPYEREVVREAPQIEPGVPLTQQVEATLRNHYAANVTAAVSHGSQPPDRGEGREETGPDRRATNATVRLATAQPAPDPEPERERVPPPQLPQRPPPPVNAPPPEPEQQQQQPFGYQQQQPPLRAPEPPSRPFAFEPQEPQQAPPPSQQAPQQAPPPPQAPPPQYDYQPPPQPAYGYQPPPQPAPAPEPDPLDVLAGLPPGHMVEIELAGSLTISGELRHVRIVPPDDGANHR